MVGTCLAGKRHRHRQQGRQSIAPRQKAHLKSFSKGPTEDIASSFPTGEALAKQGKIFEEVGLFGAI